jgi:hypothetical protein
MNYRLQLAALNAQRDREILRLRAAGLTYDEIARAVGCGHCTAYAVVNPDSRDRQRERDRRRRRNRDRARLNGVSAVTGQPGNRLPAPASAAPPALDRNGGDRRDVRPLAGVAESRAPRAGDAPNGGRVRAVIRVEQRKLYRPAEHPAGFQRWRLLRHPA